MTAQGAHRSRRWRTTVRSVSATVIVLVVVVVTSGPALAHATLIESSPYDLEQFDDPPSRIVLRFSEPVRAGRDTFRVFDADGEAVRTGTPVQRRNDEVTARLLESEARGAFVVTWRVTSLDAHPIQGAFTYQVGTSESPRSLGALERDLLAGRTASSALGVAYGIARWTLFLSLAVLVGGIVALAGLIPVARNSRGVRVLAAGAWLGVLLATIGSIVVFGPYSAGGSIGDAIKLAELDTTIGQRFGQVALVRLAILVMIAPLLVVLFRSPAPGRPSNAWKAVAGIGVVGLALTLALAGHASSGDLATAAVVLDTIHVGAMGIWLGGLLVLCFVLLSHAQRVTAIEDGSAQRFSTVAFACVAALVTTGVLQAWRQTRSFDALVTTEYGRLLIVKVVIVIAALVVANRSRHIARRNDDAGVPSRWLRMARRSTGRESSSVDVDASELRSRALGRSVAVESVLLMVVLGVTALLVNAPPARTAAQETTSSPATFTLESRRLWVDVSVTPAAVGVNTIHLTALAIGGSLNDVTEMRATLDLPDRRIGPLELTLQRLSASHYVAPNAAIPVAGDWRLTVRTLLGESRQVTLVGTLAVP